MPVISTRRATTSPITEPMAIISSSMPEIVTCGPKTVAPTASAMPTIPYQTARFRAFLIRQTAEGQDEKDAGRDIDSRDDIETHLDLPSRRSAFLEHRQHAARDHEAANDVDCGNQH